MKIVFSRHAAVDKFKELADHEFYLTKSQVTEVIRNPEHEDKVSDTPKIISSKSIDDKHVLRVVYKHEFGGIIKIITFYPAEKGRYY